MIPTIDREEIHQMFRYYVTVGIGTALDFGTYTILLTLTPLNYLVANAISFSLGTVVVYFLQKTWTFRCGDSRTAVVFGKYMLAIVVYYILTNLILMVCISYLLLNPVLAKLIQIGVTFFLGYLINKKFVFAGNGTGSR